MILSLPHHNFSWHACYLYLATEHFQVCFSFRENKLKLSKYSSFYLNLKFLFGLGNVRNMMKL